MTTKKTFENRHKKVKKTQLAGGKPVGYLQVNGDLTLGLQRTNPASG